MYDTANTTLAMAEVTSKKATTHNGSWASTFGTPWYASFRSSLDRIGRGHWPGTAVGRLVSHMALRFLLGRCLCFAVERRWSQCELRVGILRAAPRSQLSAQANAAHSFETHQLPVAADIRDNAIEEVDEGVDPEDPIGVGDPASRR